MSPIAARALGALLSVASLLASAPRMAEAAGPPPPQNLEVSGDQGWQSERTFEVAWTNPVPAGPPLTAVHYLVRDRNGEIVFGPMRADWPTHRVRVAAVGGPGTYSAEVWLEDAEGAEGPPASAPLRFDDTRPAAVEPPAAAGWVGRAELPYAVRVAHPDGPLPPSGIRGYAISVDRDPEGEPCDDAQRCADAETDLRGGVEADTLALDIPDGVSYLHAVAVSGSGMRSVAVGSAPIRVDSVSPQTRLAGVPEGWAYGPVTLRATATDATSGMQPDGDGGPFTAIRVDGGAPSVSPGPSVERTVIGSGVHAVAYYARDAAGNVDDGASANGHRNAAPPVAWVRIDRDPPRLAFLPSTHPDDPELILARASDPLSGPAPGRGWIGVRAAGSGRPFDPLPTAVEGDLLRCRWNSDAYPTGDYEFEATGYDRAGNRGVGARRQNGSAMVLPSPLKSDTRLSGWFVGHGTRLRVRPVPYGRRPAYRGRLELTSGSPLARMPVQVVERFDGGAGLPERTSTVLTGAGGDFAVRLAPGPSRTVLALFGGSRTRSRSAGEPARLEVRTRLRLRVSSPIAAVGGRPVIFHGAVAGERFPAEGLSVQLQFHLPGSDWTEFRTVRTDSRGRFRYAYRFSDDDSRGVRFLFRAYVNAQGDWPYEPGGSLPVAVRGF